MSNNYDIKVHAARYSKDAGPDDNPLVEALPEQLFGDNLQMALRRTEVLPENWRSLSVGRRIRACERLRFLYLPFDYSVTIYNLVYRGLRTAYEGKNDETLMNRQLNAIGKAIHRKDYDSLPDFIHQAESFAVLGSPGMGKTETVNRILSMFPRIIAHTEYCGQPYEKIQIPYLRVQCPPNDSIKGLCIQILSDIDSLLGTDHATEEERKLSRIDDLVCKIAALCLKFNIGLILIDEIQNVLKMRTKDKDSNSMLIKFLVELNNKTGICVFCIGTTQVEQYFTREKHLERRTRGPRIMPLEYDGSYRAVLSLIWNQMPLLERPELTQEMSGLIYKISKGVLSNITSLLISTCEYALSHGKESIDMEMVKTVAKIESYSSVSSTNGVNSPEAMYSAPKLPKEKKVKKRPPKEAQELEKTKRGRPTLDREPEDILTVYAQCHKNGMSVAKCLLMMDVAVRLE